MNRYGRTHLVDARWIAQRSAKKDARINREIQARQRKADRLKAEREKAGSK